ncbi:MFS transporter [Tropicimonas marinistellae]|uniref:MFS transporter n=1 Tax=Tropicimonas marinistellae TaxID=1739787 RepID=UPI00082B2AA7|nr:MFS transporter [Tropicimonas marinistellae]
MPVSDLRRTVVLTMLVFFAQPFATGCWMALIPTVKATLGLGEGQLAIALLGMPIGLLPSLPVAGRAIVRIGPRRALMAAFPLQAVALWLVLLAGSLPGLFLALVCLGVITAFSQVGLNTYAGRLEKERSVAIMSRCHGLWAIGLMVSSALAVFAAGLPVQGGPLLVVLSAMAGGVWATTWLPRLAGDMGQPPPPRRKIGELPPALVQIALFALVVAMTEGAMSDWSAVYMAQRLSPDSSVAGLSVSVYAATLAAGRLFGDAMRARLGAVRIARVTVAVAIAGVLCMVAPFPNWTCWVGVAMVGFGVSVGFPLGVSAVAALDDRYEGPNIAALSTIALFGFLIGPPLIGFLAEIHSLRLGLAALVPMLCASLVLAGSLSPTPHRRRTARSLP